MAKHRRTVYRHESMPGEGAVNALCCEDEAPKPQATLIPDPLDEARLGSRQRFHSTISRSHSRTFWLYTEVL